MDYSQNNYWKKRKNDILIEQSCANFVDKYWFKKLMLPLRYERVVVIDEETKERQLKGEDVVLYKWNTPVFIIDEKAKVQNGYLNKVISHPSFEILCRNQYGTSHFESWLVSPNSTTTHYAMISVASDKDVPKGEEHCLSEKDLTCMVYGLIDKKKLIETVEHETGKTMKEITDDAWQLLSDIKDGNRTRDELTIDYISDKNRIVYLKCSIDKNEQPVNLVCRRDWLRKNKLIDEIYIDREKVRKFKPTGTDKLEYSLI